jgi:histidinol-phosphatase (PHP family)
MAWMDYHLHTADSADSDESMERVCARAVELGLSEICFTEHYDTDPFDVGYGHYDDARYERRLSAVRRQFAGRLVIRKGLEFDFQSRHTARLRERLAPYSFDFLLGSVHCVFGSMPRRAIAERGYPPDEVYRAYFNELRALIATGLSHCLAHLDYVRKTCADILGAYYYGDYEQEMDDVIARLVAGGMGLEVNARNFDNGQPLAPAVDVLRMYHEAGGRLVTVGSDAHAACEVGRGLAAACHQLRAAGFTEYMAFEAGRPAGRPLPGQREILAALPPEIG